MLSMAAKHIGIAKYRQNRFVAFMISSNESRELNRRRQPISHGVHASRSHSRGARRGRARETTQRNCSIKNAFTPCTAVLTLRPTKTSREDIFMKRLSMLAAGLLIGATAFQYSNLAPARAEAAGTRLSAGPR